VLGKRSCAFKEGVLKWILSFNCIRAFGMYSEVHENVIMQANA
jgi:hypothetical protein